MLSQLTFCKKWFENLLHLKSLLNLAQFRVLRRHSSLLDNQHKNETASDKLFANINKECCHKVQLNPLHKKLIYCNLNLGTIN